MLRQCKQCGKIFSINKYRLNEGIKEGKPRGQYCSSKCCLDVLRKRRSFPDKVKVKCIICGKEVSVIPSRARKLQYCSINCKKNSNIWKQKCAMSVKRYYKNVSKKASIFRCVDELR